MKAVKEKKKNVGKQKRRRKKRARNESECYSTFEIVLLGENVPPE